MDGEAVLPRSGQFAAVGPRALDRGSGGVGDALVGVVAAIQRGIGQVVDVAALVQPGTFLEVRRGDLGDLPVDLDHVRLEPGDVALAVAPGDPGRTVVVRSEEHTSELQSRENLV